MLAKLPVYLALPLVFLPFANAHAELSDTIQSGRPGVAIGADLVPPRFLQIETGFQSLNQKAESKTSQRSSITEIRYGLLPNLELISEFDYEEEHADGEPIHKGVSDIELGVKFAIFQKSENLPSLFMRARLQMPGGESEFTQKNPAPNVVLASEYELPARFSIEGDVGARYNPDEGATEGFYALSLNKDLSDRVSVFIEGFHSLEDENGAVEGDAGVAYLVTPDLQVDLSGGWGHNGGQTQTLVSFGLSYRLPLSYGHVEHHN